MKTNNYYLKCVLIVLLGVLLFSTQPAYGQEKKGVAEKASTAKKIIKNEDDKDKTLKNEGLFEGFTPCLVKIITEDGGGSGFFVSEDGYLLTNGHVISKNDPEDPKRVCKFITIHTHDEKTFKATVIGHCLDPDVALLKIDAKNTLESPIANSDDAKTLDVSYTVGMPRGFKRTWTKGVISSVERASLNTFTKLIQTDAAINPGNSGGPLLNEKGQVIGVNTYGYGGNNLGFSIPINVAMELKKHFLKYGYFKRPTIRFVLLKELYNDLVTATGVENGIFVDHVEKDTEAYKSGLRSGDVIVAMKGPNDSNFTKVNATKRSEYLDFNWKITLMEIGKKVVFEVKRIMPKNKIKELEIEITLEEDDLYPKGIGNNEGEIKELRYDYLGLGVHELNRTYRYSRRLGKDKGVYVVTSEANKPASRAGLFRGVIITKVGGVLTPDQATFQEQLELQLAKRTKYIELEYSSGQSKSKTALTPNYTLKDKKLAIVILDKEVEYLDLYLRFCLEFGVEMDIVSDLSLSRQAHVKLKDFDASTYDGLLFVGEENSKTYWQNKKLTKLVGNAFDNDKAIAAVGPASMLLINSPGEIKEKKITTNKENANKASEITSKYTGKDVEVDGNLVTSTGFDKKTIRQFLSKFKSVLTD